MSLFEPPIDVVESSADTRARRTGPAPAPVPGSPVAQAIPWLVVLAFVVVVAPDLDVPVVRPVLALLAAVVLPTTVLHRRAGLVADTALVRLLYSFGLTVLGLILAGLLVDTVLPVLGQDRPLQPAVLAVTVGVADIALLLWRRGRGVPLLAGWSRTLQAVLVARMEVAQLLASLAVLASVLGAIRLNNGAGGGMAVAGHLLAAAALVVLLVTSGTVGRDARVVALVGLSLLLATSLRGWGIIGHDIQAEHYVYLLADSAQRWQMSSFQNAYNACLSITILPTELGQLSGLGGVVLFKVVFQVLFAAVPVATYLLSCRFVSRRLALVATSFTLAFPTFATDMPYLVRQEVAYLFLALLLLAATEPGRRRRDIVLVAVLGVAVVLSHYSTTYVLILGLSLGLVLRGGWWLWRRWRPDRGGPGREGPAQRQPRLVLLSPVLLAVLVGASLLWTGPATHTGGQVVTVARSTVATLLGAGSSTPGASVLSYSLVSGGGVSQRDRLDAYVDQTLRDRLSTPADQLLVPVPTEDVLRPAIVHDGEVSATGPGRGLAALGLSPRALNGALLLVCAAGIQLLLGLGVLRLLLGRRRGGYPVPVEYAAVCLGAVGALGVIVLIPSLSVEYGVLRVFQQDLLLVAPLLALGLELPASLLRRASVPVLVATPVVVLLVLGGVVPALFGAYSPPLALANAGTYYDRYYVDDAQEALLRWVSDEGGVPRSATVTARSTIAVKVLLATRLGLRANDKLFPTLLRRGGYIVADGSLPGRGLVTVSIEGDLVQYRYPREVLAPLSTIYSAGQDRVLH